MLSGKRSSREAEETDQTAQEADKDTANAAPEKVSLGVVDQRISPAVSTPVLTALPRYEPKKPAMQDVASFALRADSVEACNALVCKIIEKFNRYLEIQR